MGLDKTAVTSLKGIGPALANKLAKIGISNLQDVLFHLPFRYEDRTRVTPIAAVKPGDELRKQAFGGFPVSREPRCN